MPAAAVPQMAPTRPIATTEATRALLPPAATREPPAIGPTASLNSPVPAPSAASRPEESSEPANPESNDAPKKLAAGASSAAALNVQGEIPSAITTDVPNAMDNPRHNEAGDGEPLFKR